PVIDAGVAYVRNHPNSENARDVYQVLANAFEERGLFDKAISYHEMAGSPKEKIAALQDKSAKALLNAASKSGERDLREYYLTRVIDQHPDTPAAAEAMKSLANLAKEENQGLRMSKQFLMEHPELYGPRGLGLKATLFDSKAQNMEVADRGINLVADNEMLVYYQTPWGVRSESYSLAKSTTDRFFVTMREKNLQVALSDVNRRAKDSVGGIRNLRPRRTGTAWRRWRRTRGHDFHLGARSRRPERQLSQSLRQPNAQRQRTRSRQQIPATADPRKYFSKPLQLDRFAANRVMGQSTRHRQRSRRCFRRRAVTHSPSRRLHPCRLHGPRPPRRPELYR
ncbi:MAG: hypothetical protein HW373_1169, partial [Deltaproteobacteria bacterium]|nr:hypothetical protein [Deltaproteobacteria bacterium]